MSFLDAAKNTAPGQKITFKQDVAPQKETKQATAPTTKSIDFKEASNVAAITGSPSPAVVRFEILLPDYKPDTHTPSLASSAELTDSEETVEENGDKAEPSYTVADIANRKDKLNALATYLLAQCEDKAFDLKGGFRFLKDHAPGRKGRGKPLKFSRIELPTISDALRLLHVVRELLTYEKSLNITSGSETVTVTRQGKLLRLAIEGSSDGEAVFKLEEFAIGVEQQAKQYLKLAKEVQDLLWKKEQADKSNRDDHKKKSVLVGEKLKVQQFSQVLKTIKGSLSESSDQFKNQKQQKQLSKQQVQKENKGMMTLLYAMVDPEFLEADLSYLDKVEPEPEPVVVEAPKPAESKPQPQETKREKKEKKVKEVVEEVAVKPAVNNRTVNKFDIMVDEDAVEAALVAPEEKKPAPKKKPAKKVEAKEEKVEAKKVEAKKVEEPKKAEAKKVEPKKVEAKKAEPKKVEAKKVEAKKEEPKKVEVVAEKPKVKETSNKVAKKSATEAKKDKIQADKATSAKNAELANKMKKNKPADNSMLIYGGAAVLFVALLIAVLLMKPVEQ